MELFPFLRQIIEGYHIHSNPITLILKTVPLK